MDTEKLEDALATIVSFFYIIGLLAVMVICPIVGVSKIINNEDIFTAGLLILSSIIGWITMIVWVTDD